MFESKATKERLQAEQAALELQKRTELLTLIQQQTAKQLNTALQPVYRELADTSLAIGSVKGALDVSRKDALSAASANVTLLMAANGRLHDRLSLLESRLVDLPSVFADSTAVMAAGIAQEFQSLRPALLVDLQADLAPIAGAVAVEVNRRLDALIDILDRPLEQMPSKVSAMLYRSILTRKGMAGDPVICDQCGTVFSSFADHCDNCLKRKDVMPASSFPEQET